MALKRQNANLHFLFTFLLISHTIALSAPLQLAADPQCASKRPYTVVYGDDCAKIARNNNVPRGSLTAINDCSNIHVGQVLCLPDSCQLRTLSPGDTCLDLADGAKTTVSQFLAWNPFINSQCTNLIAGDQVCITRPEAPTSTIIIISPVSKVQDSYATETVDPPGAVAHGTTRRCGQYYQVREGDYCDLISNAFSLAVDLFQAINPDINDECTNLFPGLYYCVLPTADWNQTATTTTVHSSYITAPAPTASGSTWHCYEWHVIQPGDTCNRIERIYGVSIADLVLWNPSLKEDCSNLRSGRAYCVHGDIGSPSMMVPMMGVLAQPTAEMAPAMGGEVM